MECLIHFLDNGHQRELRALAQCRSEKYEDAIDQYKRIFLVQLRHSRNVCPNQDCEYYHSCKVIKDKVFSEKEERIGFFFDKIKNTYLLWLDSRVQEAFDQLNTLMEEYEIDGFEAKIHSGDIFFKGRVSEEYLTRWDMFHIPFNKRHLIRNQRYSLTGQPIVYMGRSVLGLVEELSVTDVKNFKVSVIQLPSSIKIFDLRNAVLEDLFDLDIELLFFGEIEYEIGKFYKIILASLCSFFRRKNTEQYNFCEEYVVPQLLAQVVKSKGYEGILYQSTKRFKNVKLEENKGIEFDFEYRLDYAENIALFTKINDQHVYDQQLFKSINISVPITSDMIDEISLDDLDRIKKEVSIDGGQEKVTQAETIVLSFNRIYGNMMYGEEKYIESEVGKLHLYHLYEVLHQILID